MMYAKQNYAKYKHFLYLVIVFLFLILWFLHLKETIVPRHIMNSRLDSLIPFIKEFVIAYYFWFAYMAIAFIYLGLAAKSDFYRLELFLALGMSVSYVVFMIYPNAQFPRPAVPGNDIFSMLVNFIYSHDGTNNVFPSIHVCNSIAVHLALVNCEKLKDKTLLKSLSFITALSICASTVLIKQHSIIDVAGGTILAFLVYMFIYKLPKLFSDQEDLDSIIEPNT
jgi:membrane-associated phospholipid phosphatase